MARKRLQYQAIAATIFAVANPDNNAPVGGFFSTFSQPAFSTAVPAHLQPESTRQFLYQGPSTAPDTLVFSTFSQPPPIAKVAVEQQPQPTPQFLYQGPVNTPTPLVFSAFSQPRFSQVIEGTLTAAPIFETAFPPQQTLVFSVFSQPPPLAKLPAHLHTTTTFEVQPSTIATNPFNWLFPPFEQPRFSTSVPAHLQPQVNYQVGISTVPSLTPADLVFSTFSQPPPIAKVPAHLQPDATNKIGLQGVPAITPPWFVFSKWEPPRFGPVTQSVETASALFEVAFPPQQTLVFSVFSQPPPISKLPAHLHTTAVFEVQPSQIATNPFNWLFPPFEQPRFSRTYPAHLQPQINYQVGIAATPSATPTALVFSEFSQPQFYRPYVRAEQQPQPIFTIQRDHANVPPWFTFAKWEPPRFGPVKVEQQPQPIFRTLRPDAATPTSLVFSVFSQPSFGPVLIGEQPNTIFETFNPPAATPTSLVFSLFSQPPPISKLAAHLHTQPDREIGLVGPAPAPAPLVFTDFSQPRFSTTVPAHFQPQPWQQFGPPIFPADGGSSRKLVKGRFVNPLGTARHARPKKIEIETKPALPPVLPTPQIAPRAPVPVITEDVIPAGLVSLEAQAVNALDVADVTAFLRSLDQDEQDALDIADFLATLDDDDLD